MFDNKQSKFFLRLDSSPQLPQLQPTNLDRGSLMREGNILNFLDVVYGCLLLLSTSGS